MNEIFDNPEILRALIMDHYKYPRNHGPKNLAGYKKIRMNSESCIDDITLEVKIENNVINDITFDGYACTISTASTSIMTELLKGKTIEEANYIIENYFNMVEEKPYDSEVLSEAIAMKNVYKQANRIKCATIGWNGIKEAILERSKDEQK